MREIKFRAWDKEMNQMTDVKSFHFHQWYVDTDLSMERNSFKNEETDRHILMQYTGLKDKNGKEIWEGDILANRKIHRDNFYCIVESMRGGCFFGVTVPGRNHNRPLFNMMNDEGAEYDEVIGNIYENPELLVKE